MIDYMMVREEEKKMLRMEVGENVQITIDYDSFVERRIKERGKGGKERERDEGYGMRQERRILGRFENDKYGGRQCGRKKLG